MKTITIASSKGGVSKSLISVCLYLYLKKQSKKVFLLDTDKQKSSLRFLKKLDNDDENVDYLEQNIESFKASVELLSSHNYDYLIVDTSPTITAFNTAVIANSNKVLLCSKPSIFDVESLLDKLDVLKQTETQDYSLIFTQVVNNAIKTKQNIKDLKNGLTEQGFKVLNNTLSHSTAYLNAINEIDNIFENAKYRKQQNELTKIFEELLR
ncbi:AAA family ATPase [Ursidibacter arcticus]